MGKYYLGDLGFRHLLFGRNGSDAAAFVRDAYQFRLAKLETRAKPNARSAYAANAGSPFHRHSMMI